MKKEGGLLAYYLVLTGDFPEEYSKNLVMLNAKLKVTMAAMATALVLTPSLCGTSGQQQLT